MNRSCHDVERHEFVLAVDPRRIQLERCRSGHQAYRGLVMFLALAFLIPSISCSAFGRGCDKQVLKRQHGVVSSPGYPVGYNENVSCTWIVKGAANQLITISFNEIDIEDDAGCRTPPCCRHNWLKIGSPFNQTVQRYCGRNLQPPPLVSTDIEVWIKFRIASVTDGGRGFRLKYSTSPLTKYPCSEGEFFCEISKQCISKAQQCNGRRECQDGTDELNCKGACPIRAEWCGGNRLTECFLSAQKCDGILDCINGADEIGCMSGCEEKIRCLSGNGCYDRKERCNGIAQCNDFSDEKNCNSDLCKSENGGFLCKNLRCIRESWTCDETNDCGDLSDENINCIKNSVITAAVMGSLICGLLLVIAIGCTCKLYALRIQDNRNTRYASTLSRLERDIMQREPPPPYSMAISDPSAQFFQQAHVGLLDSRCQPNRGRSGRRIRRLRRHRRRPPTPPPQQVPSSQDVNSARSPGTHAPESMQTVEVEPQVTISSPSLLLSAQPEDTNQVFDSCIQRFVSKMKNKANFIPSRPHHYTETTTPSSGDQASVSSEPCGSSTGVLTQPVHNLDSGSVSMDVVMQVVHHSRESLASSVSQGDGDDCPLLVVKS